MARGGRASTKHQSRNMVQLKKDDQDESDEDYMVGEGDEIDESESEDEYNHHLSDDETEDSLGEFEEEKHTKKVKKVGRPRGRRSSRGRNGVKLKNDFVGAKGRKKCIQGGKKDEFGEELRIETSYSSAKRKADHSNEKPRKETNYSYGEEGQDSDWNDFDVDDDGDKEFTPDEVDGDEVLPVMKKNKVNRLRVQEAQSAKKKRQNRKLKTTRRKKPKRKNVKRKNRFLVKESRDEGSVEQKTKRGTGSNGGIGKLNASSDSDAAASGFSIYEYTISEEEREQIREAREICKSLTTDLRSLSSLKMIKEEETVPSQRKRPRTKEKEMVDTNIEVGKQVCGICLSEQAKRTVRGILNCCSHYFCFACIMEWSKVESRCPLCKQRFATISKPAQVVGVHSLRDVIFPVPERDQVYQPSAEELRGYLDPYEDVLCTECHQGGDDALMLLCDLCDSPAHTYCVGLGSDVPEGNWYCVVCKPTVLASENAQALPTPHHGANNVSDTSSPIVSARETFDLNELYVPETPFSQAALPSASPRYSVGYSHAAASTAYGSVALTVYERRRIQQQIHHLILSNSRPSERSDAMASLSGINHFGSQIRHDEIANLQAVSLRGMPHNIHQQQGRLPYYATPTPTPTPSLYGLEVLSPVSISFSGQVPHHQASTSTNDSLCSLLRPEFFETTTRIGHGLDHQQVHPYNSISNTRVSTSLREVRCSVPQKEHVQSMVKSHLKSFSRDSDLGYVTFKKIARSSTHTILAAFRVEHRQNEVYPVETRPLVCHHLDRQKSAVAGQCSSCLDWFIRNVVKEVMSIREQHK